jgi:hypothetical protein
MKQWMNRFALLAAIAGILSSALVMGCGGGEEDTGAAGTTNGTNSAGGDTTTGTSTDAP